MESDKKKKSFHYGWIVTICCTMMVCGSSLVSTGMSTNLNAMRQFYGLTNTQSSLVLTVRSISAFIVALGAVKYFDIFGVKKGAMIAMLSGTVAFVIFAFAGPSMPLLFIGAVFAGIAYSYGMMMPASLLLHSWFRKSLGTALGIAAAGTGLMSVIFAPLVQTVLNNFGIKAGFLLQGGYMALVAIALLLLVTDTPADKNLEPYGGADFKAEGKKRGDSSLTSGWRIAIIAAAALMGACSGTCTPNFTNHYVTLGIEAINVAKAMSLYGALLIIFKIIFGKSVDKLGVKRSTEIFGILCIAGLLVMTAAKYVVTIPFMYLGFIITGIGAVILTLGYPNWVADLDARNYNHTLEKCQMGYQLGALVVSPIPGILADLTGTYSPGYAISTAVSGLGVIIVLAAYKARKKNAE